MQARYPNLLYHQVRLPVQRTVAPSCGQHGKACLLPTENVSEDLFHESIVYSEEKGRTQS